MIGLGQVVDTRDPLESGSLVIKPLTPLGNAQDDSITAAMCSMSTGGDQGFTCIPGPGSYVLFVDVESLCATEEAASAIGLQHKYVWLTAIATQTMMTKNQSIVANSASNADDYCNEQKDYLARDPQNSGLLVGTGTPEEGAIYNSEGQPQKTVWKFLSGHKIVMSRLVDGVLGRNENNLNIQTAGGKYLKMDDGPPELSMDRITLRDENKNRLEIRTGGLRPNSSLLETGQDQEYTTLRGCQHMTIMEGSTGSQLRDNIGKGNIEDHAHQANHVTTAYVDIKRTSHTGDITEICEQGDITYQTDTGNINVYAATDLDVDAGQSITIDAPGSITLTCGLSKISMTPVSVTIDSPLINLNAPAINANAALMGAGVITVNAGLAGVIGITGITTLMPSTFGSTNLNFHTHFWPGMFPIPTSSPVT